MYHPDLSSATPDYDSGNLEGQIKYPMPTEGHHQARKAGFKVLYIGWLEVEHPYPKGEVSPEFIEALQAHSHNPKNRWKGYHTCDFCGKNPVVKYGKGYWMLGSADIEVRGGNTIYFAPALTLHYVTAHGYLPPQEFIDAVLATRKSGS